MRHEKRNDYGNSWIGRDACRISGVALCEAIIKECSLLIEMMDFMTESSRIAAQVGAIEDDADQTVRQLGYYIYEHNLLNDMDIYKFFKLLRNLEQSTDEIEELANLIVRLNITEVNDYFVSSLAMMHDVSQKMLKLVIALRDKEPMPQIVKMTTEIDEVKIEYYKVYNFVIKDMFDKGYNAVDIIRWKDIYTQVRVIFKSFENISENVFRFLVADGIDVV